MKRRMRPAVIWYLSRRKSSALPATPSGFTIALSQQSWCSFVPLIIVAGTGFAASAALGKVSSPMPQVSLPWWDVQLRPQAHVFESALQPFELQSVLATQALPARQLFAATPPQSRSVSVPFFTPSESVGTWQMLPVQIWLVQSRTP